MEGALIEKVFTIKTMKYLFKCTVYSFLFNFLFLFYNCMYNNYHVHSVNSEINCCKYKYIFFPNSSKVNTLLTKLCVTGCHRILCLK